MSQNVLQNVIAAEDIVWHQTDLGPNFWTSDELVGTEYSTLFSAQMTKFGPGDGSAPHHHDYNHTRSTSSAAPAAYNSVSSSGRPSRAPWSRFPPTSCTVSSTRAPTTWCSLSSTTLRM